MSARSDFWARRKAAVAAEAEAEARVVAAEKRAEDQAALEEKTDAELLAEFDLPDPDTLRPGDDIRGFMTQAVPDRLRRRALRQLWKLNPVLANLDELVDYGEDFTDGAMVVENLQTAYQVGKGMLSHLESLTTEADKPPLAEELRCEESPQGLDEPLAEPPAPPVATATDPQDPPAPAPRRMRFEFESTA
ncbi:DUF3306 domain-containing protein [Thalassococcus sp. S3]|uniref:DUF3306 domain-containing protein n=1 Tax=Thalassococcus sp. S3 TaxID=2017482 RepID=UPI0010247B18|nr:DUF3306 domain-containing protein [Thalassococcus sp. S3]QBF32394.1 hypothetical protein CFI11_14395 [Thalassococcus sp. S3]